MKYYYNQSTDEIIASTNSSPHGLSSSEADKRLAKYGANAITVKGVPLWRKIVEPFANVMMVVLFVAGLLGLWQGHIVDTVIIFAIIMASALIDWVQRYSTNRILHKLREQETEQVEVIRDNQSQMVDPQSVVTGDLVILREGQKVPADCRIIDSTNLHVDESMLTGESMSIKKTSATIKGDREVYDQTNMVFGGSFVVTGSAQALVVATANNTEFGKIAVLAGNSTTSESPIQQKIDRLVRRVVIMILILAIIVLCVQVGSGMQFIDSLQFVLAFAVSAVPESLPIAITVVLAIGMKRMAKHRALVRNIKAIENIGLVTVIATDKTGTLTKNELSVIDNWSPKFDQPALALQTGFSVSEAGKSGDPLDTALADFLRANNISGEGLAQNASLIAAFPFEYELAMSGNCWQFGASYSTYLKGAPEKILALCNLGATKLAEATQALDSFTSKGHRVIAICMINSKTPIKNLADISANNHSAELIGLIAVADQIRPRVDSAVKLAHSAGIRVCMVTGDHSETAYSIANAIGIADDKGQVYDSQKLAKLTPSKLAQVVGATRVYARVTPDTKHAILGELNKGEITAMTGDGVNDVPALTQAHIGIAMGSGSAIAKDAGDIVLLDDNFRSIIVAVREGRTIISNIRRMLVYLLATNAGEVLVTIGALIIGLPLPLAAVQILWINLATDTFLVIPLGLEPARGDVMNRPPGSPSAGILNRYMVGQMVLSAGLIAIITLGVYGWFYYNASSEEARSAAFIVLIMIQWVNALLMRSSDSVGNILKVRNRAFSLAIIGTILLQTIILCVPEFRSALHVNGLNASTIGAGIVAAALVGVIMEIYKYIIRKKVSGGLD